MKKCNSGIAFGKFRVNGNVCALLAYSALLRGNIRVISQYLNNIQQYFIRSVRHAVKSPYTKHLVLHEKCKYFKNPMY